MALKRSYRFFRGLVRVCTRRMRAEWAQPFTGEPSVFVCNHAGALGPIDICAKFPLADELHPWMNAQVLSAREVPAYVRQDYWWRPDSRWAPVLTRTLPYVAAAILPPILRTTPTVPVYHDIRVMRTLRESIRILKAGEHLVIFPEQPSGHGTHEQALNAGFLQLAPAYARVTGRALAFWPVHIDSAARVFHVGRPLYYEPARALEEQAGALLEALGRGIRKPVGEEG
jgi:1-acyl-sn-glycerol-3-phosphate acyltransferase